MRKHLYYGKYTNTAADALRKREISNRNAITLGLLTLSTTYPMFGCPGSVVLFSPETSNEVTRDETGWRWGCVRIYTPSTTVRGNDV